MTRSKDWCSRASLILLTLIALAQNGVGKEGVC